MDQHFSTDGCTSSDVTELQEGALILHSADINHLFFYSSSSSFSFLEIHICEPRSSQKGNYLCVITGSPLCFPGLDTRQPRVNNNHLRTQ